MSSEWLAALDLLKQLLLDPRKSVLIGLLIVAAAIDVRSHRIPNWLVLVGIVFAVLYSGFFPEYTRENGWTRALGGLAVGFACFLPFYLARAMGAGDVKLMAMVGAFLGPWGSLSAVLSTLIAGGLLAVASMLYSGSAPRVARDLGLMFRTVASLPQLNTNALGGGPSTSPRRSPMKLPYGLAIAIGTITYLVLKQLALI